MRVRPGVELGEPERCGCQRENNEDRYSYWEPTANREFPLKGRLAIVADGMGGYEGGQEASRIAVEAIEEVYSNGGCRRTAHLASGGLPDRAPAHPGIRRKVSRPVRHGDHLHGDGAARPSALFSRTSGTAACTWCAVLPSHVLRTITLMSAVWSKAVSFALKRPNPIPNAISSPPRWEPAATVTPDCPAQPVVARVGRVLVLCTDGLWGLLTEAEIQAAVAGKTAAEICDTSCWNRKTARRPGQHHHAGPASQLMSSCAESKDPYRRKPQP